jgi:hypothetical protein
MEKETVIPERILASVNTSENRWEPAGVGLIANTFLGEKTVIQQRPIDHYSRYKSVIDYLNSNIYPLNKELFQGARIKILSIEEECFWTSSKRLDQPKQEYPWKPYSRPDKWWDYLQQSFTDIVQALTTLRKGPDLPKNLIDFVERADAHYQIVDHQQVISVLAKYGADEHWLNSLPVPEDSRKVISHGDLLIKNIVHGAKHNQIIDWEFLTVMPADRDLTRLFSHLCLRTPPEEWEQRIKPYQEDYSILAEADYRLFFIWGLLRSLAIWPEQGEMIIENKNSFHDNLQGIKNISEQLIS